MSDHYFKSFETIQSKDTELMLSDSRRYDFLIKRVKHYLQLDHLLGFHWLRLIDFEGIQSLSTLSPEDVKLYFSSGAWKVDSVIVPEQTVSYYTMDYKNNNLLDKNNPFVQKHGNEVYIVIGKQYRNYTDKFTFDIHRDYFYILSPSAKMQLYKRLDNIISLMYSIVKFQHTFYFEEYNIEMVKASSSIKKIIEAYGINQNDFEQLMYVATGNTAKEIAIHMDKPYRSIQNNISMLSKKLNCENKQQLTLKAKIITSYIQADRK